MSAWLLQRQGSDGCFSEFEPAEPRRGSSSKSALGIKQLGEAGIVGHVAEVRVITCLEAGAGVEADGFGEMLQTLRGAAGKTLQHGEAIPDEVESRALGGELSRCSRAVTKSPRFMRETAKS